MEEKQVLEDLKAAIAEGDVNRIRRKLSEAVSSNIDPLRALEEGLLLGMAVVEERFHGGETCLPEILKVVGGFKAAMEILKPEIERQKKEVSKLGTVLIATVGGDVHSIGKDIVGIVLGINGFKVVDIGVDKSTLNIIETAEKVKVDVIALSSLMTTTMLGQEEVINALKERKLRNKYFVIVGGGPVSQEWADKIDADGYGKNAIEAVKLVKKLLIQRDSAYFI
jgi:trimethylamine corrinoid protein